MPAAAMCSAALSSPRLVAPSAVAARPALACSPHFTVSALQGRQAAARRRSAPARLPPARASHREEEGGVAAVGLDLNWSTIARDLKHKVASVASDKASMQDQLQAWLGEADLRQRGESDVEEHSQAEMVAEIEAAHQGLEGASLDVKAWLGEGGSAEQDSQMAAALVMRLLQAYHKEAGEPFDDEEEDNFWRLQGFVPGGLVGVLDHDTLKRVVKGYLALPFSGV